RRAPAALRCLTTRPPRPAGATGPGPRGTTPSGYRPAGGPRPLARCCGSSARRGAPVRRAAPQARLAARRWPCVPARRTRPPCRTCRDPPTTHPVSEGSDHNLPKLPWLRKDCGALRSRTWSCWSPGDEDARRSRVAERPNYPYICSGMSPAVLAPVVDEVAAAPADGRLRRGQASRRAILDAATAVITEAGVGALTHRAVAAEAGLPPARVTYHFPTVEDLMG